MSGGIRTVGDSINDRTRIAAWRKLKYQNPEDTLRRLRELQRLVARSDLPESVKNLRQRELRKFHESRQAALFAFGMGKKLGVTVYFTLREDADYDAVCLWRTDDAVEHYAPVQLKELPPASTNPQASLEEQLRKLTKYADSADLQVVIYLNRTVHIDFTTLEIPVVNVGGIWLVGGVSRGQRRWVLIGDLKTSAEATHFDHPEPLAE